MLNLRFSLKFRGKKSFFNGKSFFIVQYSDVYIFSLSYKPYSPSYAVTNRDILPDTFMI